MLSKDLGLKVNFFCGTYNRCMRAATVSPPNHVILYRIPYAHAHILDSKRKAFEQGYTGKRFESYQDELKMAGTYILINSENHSAYIGKADCRSNGKGLIRRMLDKHKRKKDSIKWDIGFALTSKNEDLLSENEISYLEWLFYTKAYEAGQYSMENKQRPSEPDERKKANVEEKLASYIDDAFDILSCQAGCDIFEIKKKDSKKEMLSPSENSEERPKKNRKKHDITSEDLHINVKRKRGTNIHDKKMLHMNSRKADAYGFYLGEKFVVKAGSKLAFGIKESLKKKPSYHKRRVNLEKNGVDNNLVLLSDEVFDSISEAACVIGGTSLSGTVWKEIKETTLDLPFGD